MADILLINGTFGSGKTALARALERELASLNNLSTHRVADGPHLVHQIKNVAHGENGGIISDAHYHPWMQGTKGHHHQELSEASHFPFTVLKTPVTDAMIRGFLAELWQVTQNPDLDLIIAELGTGLPDKTITRVDLTTARFLQIAREQQPFWPQLKEKITAVVMVDADWEIRLKRNGHRPQIADGIDRSWGMVVEAMNITRHPDFDPWDNAFPRRTIIIDNNPPLDEEGRRIEPVLELLRKTDLLPGPIRYTKIFDS